MNLNKSIKIALAKREITALELASRLGVSSQRIYMIANQKAVRSDTIERIAKALDFKMSEFIALGEE